MADTGWVTPGTGANNADAGDVAWSNASNITTATDAARADASSLPKNTGTSQYLHATNFDFSSIPSGATIDGIEARVRKGSSTNTANRIYEHTIQLIVGGSRAGSNKGGSGSWVLTTSTATFGGATDLWGLAPSQSDVASSNFGLAVRAVNTNTGTGNAFVYYVQLKVHYTEAAGNTGAFFALFNVKDRIREILKPKKKFWLPESVFARAA